MRRITVPLLLVLMLAILLPMILWAALRQRLFGLPDGVTTKLYRRDADGIAYWETWPIKNGMATIHWGRLGDTGEQRDAPLAEATAEMDTRRSEGFAEIDHDDLYGLEVVYEIDATDGSSLRKRHALENRLNELLGWTGLGHMDGGSIGSGTMESFVYVVDPEIGKRVIADDLRDTRFGDYVRIVVHEPFSQWEENR